MRSSQHRIVALVLAVALGMGSLGSAPLALAQDAQQPALTATPSAEAARPPAHETSPFAEQDAPGAERAEPAERAPLDPALQQHDGAEAPVAPQDATPPAVHRLEDDAPSVLFAGRWTYRTSEDASGRSYRYSRTAGASARTAFWGTGVTWIAPVGPNRGRARVYVDGVSAGTVDLYRSAAATGQAVFTTAGLSDARHTLRIVVLGSRNASSTASNVHVDALDIEGTPAGVGPIPGARVQDGDPKLYRKGRWSTFKRSGAFGGTVAMTTVRDAGCVVRFRGTGVTWYGRKNALGGRAEIWLDGRRVAIVDQYSPVQMERRVVYAASGLPYRNHTLRIRALAVPPAPGGGARTELDAFQVNGTVLTAFRPTPFRYPWKNYIVIDKSSYKLYLVKNGWLRATYPIAHGKNNCTPERVWRIDAKYPHTSGVYGPRKMRLFKRVRTSSGSRYVFSAYGIHGTNQPWVIGTQASHGCIRMYNKDVIELYPQVPLGTMVVTRR